jgi:hypothetical protein
MIGKKINQLATELAPASTDLTIIGDPISGVSKKITIAQLGAIFSGAVAFYTNLAGFPVVGDINVIYCAKDTQKLYLWSGSAYVEVFPSQALLNTYQLRSEKGNANGYASLDSLGKVPISQLPSSLMEYKGTWNAATNTPTLANGTGDTGDVYICNVAGSVNFGAGAITFAVGDYVIYSGTIWQRSSGAVGTVTSVAASITGNSIGITGSPITTSGTLALAFAGTSAQYVNGAGNLITFPTSLISGSGASGQVTFFNGANSVTGTNNFFWDATNNRLGIGTTTPQRSIEIFNSTADNHLRLSGNAPSVSMGEAVTGSIYQAKFGLVTTNGQFASAGVAGDFVIISQTGATIFVTNSTEKMRVNASGNMSVGNTNDTYRLDVTGTARLTGQLRLESTITNGTYTYTLPSATGTLALTSDIPSVTGYVPYTGATANVDLGSFDLTTDIINLNQLKAVGSGGLNIYSNSGTHIALMGGGGGAGTTFYGGIIGVSASFTSSGSSDTFGITHSSGSGIALNITKGGNGEGLYINKTSGSGNAATIIGTLNATTLVKSGGTSSQFLKADGSVDSTAYGTGSVTSVAALTIGTTGTDLSSTVANSTTTPVITLNVPTASATNRGALLSADWTTFNNKQPQLNGTGFVKASGTTITYDNSTYLTTSAASTTYLPLVLSSTTNFVDINGQQFSIYGSAGGFTSGRIIVDPVFSALGYQNAGVFNGLKILTNGNAEFTNSGITRFFNQVRFDSTLTDGTNTYTLPSATGTIALTSALSGYLPLTGGTLTGALGGTSATFSSNFYVSGGTNTNVGNGIHAYYESNYAQIQLNGATGSLIDFSTSGTDFLGRIVYTNATNQFEFKTNSSGTSALTLASTGAATFSANVNVNTYLSLGTGSGKFLAVGGAVTAGSSADMLMYNTGGDLIFWGTGAVGMILKGTSGNLGIGTSSPSALLHLSSGTPSIYIDDTSTSGTRNRFRISSGDIGTTQAALFQFDNTSGTNLITTMIVNELGNVGIGTTSPVRKLDIVTTGEQLRLAYDTSGSTYTDFRNDSAGGLLINTSANYIINYIAGSAKTRINSNGDFIVFNLGTGLVYSNGGALTSTNPSDQRLKNTIKALSYGLNEILQLNPKTFYYNDDVNKERLKYGFIAQEVKGIMPELARKLNAETDYLGLETEGIYVTLVNAIKELKQELDTLKNK